MALWACATAPGEPATPGEDPGTSAEEPAETLDTGEAVEADPVAVLFRASLDLRGVRPTVAEIEAVEADPDALEELLDAFVQDPRLEDRIVDLFGEIYLTRVDSLTVSAASYGLDDEVGFASAVGQEPLRILARIVVEDLPFTELVVADWTMATDDLATAWDLDREDGDGWQVAAYTDGRPTAGILSTNGMWWRYGSTYSNANRGRANAISKILLCSDYLSRPIEFDRNVDLLDEDAVSEAVLTNEGCVGCHATLDPLAAYLWGFYYGYVYSRLDITSYHPERESYWEEATTVAPGFYGEPGNNLSDLGEQLAGDNRLPECLVEHTWELLLQRDVTLDDTNVLVDLREVLLSGEGTIKPLLRAIVDQPEYRIQATDDPQHAAVKLTRPELLASQLEDLTGFRFTYDDYDLLSTDTYGLRTLAGGVDGGYVTAPAPQITATAGLVYERVAQAAAWYAVDAERGEQDTARLFPYVGFTETPDSGRDAMVAQIQHLHLQLFGDRVQADGPEVEANLELWTALYEAEASAEAAWAGLLSVLLRDPDFLLY